MVGAALAAASVGLLGADAGILWLVGGVWTVRRVWGSPVGFAWGAAILAAGLRWGTLDLADVQSAARLIGPAVAAGPPLAAAGAAAALAAALVEEARIDGLRSASAAERLAAAAALSSLLIGLLLPGPRSPGVWPALALWAAAGVAGTALLLAGTPLARRLPRVLSWLAAAGGLVAVGVAT